MVEKKETIFRWYQEVWINGRWEQMDEIYRPAPDEECLIPGATADPEEAREIVNALNNLMSDHKLRILNVIEEGDWVSALVEMNGVKAGTEIPIQARWLTMSRIANGCIVESYPQVNLIPFFEQLGQLPPHSFELLLGGGVLR